MSRQYEGFKVNVDGIETFVVTERKRVTKTFSKMICKALKFSTEDWMVNDMWGCIREAVLEIRNTARHGILYNVYSDEYTNTGITGDAIRIIEL